MPIKILIVSDYRDPVSTRPEAHAIIGLAKRGLDIHVMTFENTPYQQQFEKVGITIIPFHPEKKFDIKAIRFMRKTIKQNGYQIAHFFNSRASINGIQATRGLDVKIVLYRGFAGHVHWYDPTNYLKYLHPRVSKIMCIAKAPADHIRAQRFFNPDKLEVIHKGHDPAWYEGYGPIDVQEIGIPKDVFTVVHVSNVRPMKGIPYLLKSSYYLPKGLPIHYIFIGKGMDDPELQQIINESPYKENIHCLGFRKDVLNIVKASNTFCLSSLWGESINKATIEAMSLGTTPIITDIAGNKILVEHGKSGLVVPTKDPKAIADAILKLYQNPKLNEQMGINAKHRMQTVLHIDKTVEKMKIMYEKLVG